MSGLVLPLWTLLSLIIKRGLCLRLHGTDLSLHPIYRYVLEPRVIPEYTRMAVTLARDRDLSEIMFIYPFKLWILIWMVEANNQFWNHFRENGLSCKSRLSEKSDSIQERTYISIFSCDFHAYTFGRDPFSYSFWYLVRRKCNCKIDGFYSDDCL